MISYVFLEAFMSPDVDWVIMSVFIYISLKWRYVSRPCLPCLGCHIINVRVCCCFQYHGTYIIHHVTDT